MIVKEPTFFRALSDVKILKDGALFYKAPSLSIFSLPSGDYDIHGKIKKIKYKRKTEPLFFEPEKNIPFKGIRKILFRPNLNKCSIYVELGLIIFDENFYKKLNDVQRNFILSHEMGHYFYYTEKKADTFATVMLLLMGYNPSQINSAVNSTLIGEFRKKENLALLKNRWL